MVNFMRDLVAQLLFKCQFSCVNSSQAVQRDCGKAKFSERIKWQDSNTPTTTPYKAFSGALLL